MSFTSIADLEDKHKRALTEANRIAIQLERERGRLARVTPEQHVAEELHRIKCHCNHTDGCGWFYADWDSPREEHQDYLSMAHNVLAQSGESVSAVLSILRAIPSTTVY